MTLAEEVREVSRQVVNRKKELAEEQERVRREDWEAVEKNKAEHLIVLLPEDIKQWASQDPPNLYDGSGPRCYKVKGLTQDNFSHTRSEIESLFGAAKIVARWAKDHGFEVRIFYTQDEDGDYGHLLIEW